LCELAGNLSEDQFCHIKRVFGDGCNLLIKKGISPHDWFPNFEKLNETKLPEKTEFY